jgi:hypothetical protein
MITALGKDILMKKQIYILKDDFYTVMRAFRSLYYSPFISIITVLLFIVIMVSFILSGNRLINYLLLLGLVADVSLCAGIMEKRQIEDKHFVYKNGIFSLFWLISCVATYDFKNFPNLFSIEMFEFVVKYSTAFVYIFLACLLADFISTYDPQIKKKEKEFEEMKVQIRELNQKIKELENKKEL